MASAERSAVDTSVAVACLDASHAAHGPCRDAVRERRPALAGHAAFETWSVLTRMPGQLSIDPAGVDELLTRVFPERVWLPAAEQDQLLRRLPALGLTGGAVYDALVGSAALTAGRTLLTRDLRARRTYDLLGVSYTLVGP